MRVLHVGDEKEVGAASSDAVGKDSDQSAQVLEMAWLLSLFGFLLAHFLLLCLDVFGKLLLLLANASPGRLTTLPLPQLIVCQYVGHTINPPHILRHILLATPAIHDTRLLSK